ncbi:MAG: hypothetical protein B7Y79_00240 [Rhodospirillales bacterium 35-44-4]|nr:MAG: hypothetical protein B7Y79_00240 [Rhodospirillales bacterium 35-44-4]
MSLQKRREASETERVGKGEGEAIDLELFDGIESLICGASILQTIHQTRHTLHRFITHKSGRPVKQCLRVSKRVAKIDFSLPQTMRASLASFWILAGLAQELFLVMANFWSFPQSLNCGSMGQNLSTVFG